MRTFGQHDAVDPGRMNRESAQDHVGGFHFHALVHAVRAIERDGGRARPMRVEHVALSRSRLIHRQRLAFHVVHFDGLGNREGFVPSAGLQFRRCLAVSEFETHLIRGAAAELHDAATVFADSPVEPKWQRLTPFLLTGDSILHAARPGFRCVGGCPIQTDAFKSA